ncbi:MAG: protease [Martelella sp.]|uniref:type 1 glutamine amidotransferase domain-containing protein n=1 Tax=unclassified Martelella TaxID=2629616 RepID=UPI000C413780|nr:type 1 glutamine amidotransferase domain-containing protein [Martelella sp.]MAU21171.1 protease [Martelella sp.]|tara:strand:+ start:184 stop:744 length:561 start_codon:yes stop_codon:yes gene_type:complete
MPGITQSKILILATNGYERSELRVPLDSLKQKGASVTIASLEKGPIKSWDEKDWGDSVDADLTVDDVNVADYDAIVLPGGQINPDVLRTSEKAVAIVKEFVSTGRIVAAICHGPWMLVEADVLKGREATSYPSIRTDMKNAGANWVDREVVTDNGIITSRNPKDLPAFVDKIVEEVEEGRHPRKAA